MQRQRLKTRRFASSQAAFSLCALGGRGRVGCERNQAARYCAVARASEAIKRVWVLDMFDCRARYTRSQWHVLVSLRALALQSTGNESPQQRIPRKSARKAMAKPQHSRALKITIFNSPLLIDSILPTTAHSGNVRAVGITLTHALWSMT